MVEAVSDYRYFLDRGYPGTSALQLVGDRYRLSRQDRMVLYRGVCDEDTARRHRARLVSAAYLHAGPARRSCHSGRRSQCSVYPDELSPWAAVCSSPMTGLSGMPAAQIDESRTPEILADVIRSFCEFLARHTLPAHVFLDEPLTHSHDHARVLREAAAETGAIITVSLARSADAAILDQPDRPIASSDSAVIDGTSGPIVDIARFILEEAFKADLMSLSESYPRVRSFL